MNQALKRKDGLKKTKLTSITKRNGANNTNNVRTAKLRDYNLIFTKVSVVGRGSCGVVFLKYKLINI